MTIKGSFRKLSFIKRILVISIIPTLLYTVVSLGTGILFPEIGSKIDSVLTLYSYIRSVLSIYLISILYIGIFGVLVSLLQKYIKQESDLNNLMVRFKKLKFIYKVLIIAVIPAFLFTMIMVCIEIQDSPIDYFLYVKSFINIYILCIIKVGIIGVVIRLFQK